MLNISYHSASLTFYFLMSVISIFTLIVFITSKLIMLNIGEVYYLLSQFFPQITESFVQTVFLISKQSTNANILLIFMAIYFSKDFFLALAKAFQYITDRKSKNRLNLYIMIFFLPVIILLITFIYLLKLFLKIFIEYFATLVYHLKLLFGDKIDSIYHFLLNIQNLMILNNIFEFLILFLFVFSGYYLLLDFGKKNTAYVSLFITIIILLIKITFGALVKYFFSKSPLFTVMGSVFMVILWFKIVFDIMLIGGRFLYYLDKLDKASKMEA